MRRKTADLAAPSKTDLAILAVLWDKGRATGRDIHEAIVASGVLRRTVAYTTVKTYLDRLVQKGYAVAETLGDSRGTYLYSATVSRQDVRDQPGWLDRIVSALGLRPSEFAQWFHQTGQMSEKDLADLKETLRRIERNPPHA